MCIVCPYIRRADQGGHSLPNNTHNLSECALLVPVYAELAMEGINRPIIHRAGQGRHWLSIYKQSWPGRHYLLNDAQLSGWALIGPYIAELDRDGINYPIVHRACQSDIDCPYISSAGHRGHKLPNRTESLPEWTLVVYI